MAGASDRLTHYQAKRQFNITTEPRGNQRREASTVTTLRYVIQRHQARRLHYDFRLEWDGVLVSWAVPKGPSLDPDVKRLAVHVEDHPVEYGKFEGRIPAGQYGAGIVEIWDSGTWTPLEDAAAGMEKGHLKFRLQGERLAGDWILFRATRRDGDADNWMLRKLPDDFARAGHDAEADMRPLPASAKASPAKKPASRARTGKAGEKPARASPRASKDVQRADPLPERLDPQLATLVEAPPQSEGWVYEVKFDGYRMLARVGDGEVELYSRNGRAWLDRLPHLVKALGAAGLPDAWLDGEIVVLRQDGLSDFQALQQALDADSSGVLYMVFDLLYWNGRDLRGEPLSARQAALDELFRKLPAKGPVLRSGLIASDGDLALREACRLGLEGLIGKQVDSLYAAGRSRSWIKLKCRPRQEFVIGGFTEPTGSRSGLGALLVGIYDDAGVLDYAGRVGTGFNARLLEKLRRQLDALETDKCPFARRPPPGGRSAAMHWVKPQLVAEVAFAGWTSDGVLRQAAFQGLRDDKRPQQVHEEVAVELPASTQRTAKASVKAAQKAQKEARGAPTREASDMVRGVRISHPERVIFGEMGARKIDLARYYDAVAEHMLPHLQGRPLSLVRCPRGSEKTCFFQKHVDEAPSGTHQVSIAEPGEAEDNLLVVDTIDGVVALVQLGVIELHTWGAREPRIEYPDRMVMDLDPDPALPWKTVLEGAQLVRTLLDELKLPNYVKSTGGKGLHVVVPLKGTRDWNEVKAFAKALADHISSVIPQRFTSNMAKVNRRGKIFVDYLRNGRQATAVCAFSARARAGAPVSVPLAWDELQMKQDLRDAWFNITNVPQFLQQRSDPWAGFARAAVALSSRHFKLLGLTPAKG